jgi:regulator of protease activity HflC (stomatin/prohibitin superfamily)
MKRQNLPWAAAAAVLVAVVAAVVLLACSSAQQQPVEEAVPVLTLERVKKVAGGGVVDLPVIGTGNVFLAGG